MSTEPSVETTPAKESTSSSATILVAILVLFTIGLIAYIAFANVDTNPGPNGGVRVESPYGSPGSATANPPSTPSAGNGDGRNAGGNNGAGTAGTDPGAAGRAPTEATSAPTESGGMAGTGTPGGRATTESGERGGAASTGALPGEGSR